MAAMVGLEPTTSSLTERRSYQLSYIALLWHGRKDLNPQPTDLESATLPIELLPYIKKFPFLASRDSVLLVFLCTKTVPSTGIDKGEPNLIRTVFHYYNHTILLKFDIFGEESGTRTRSPIREGR